MFHIWKAHNLGIPLFFKLSYTEHFKWYVKSLKLLHDKGKKVNVKKLMPAKQFHNIEQLLSQYPEPTPEFWLNVEKDFARDQLENNDFSQTTITNAVLNACINTNSIDHCISYYEFLKANGKKLSITEYYLILLVLSQKPSNKNIEPAFVNEVFESVKPYFKMHNAIFEVAAKAFYSTKKFWKEMFKVKEWEGQENSDVNFYLCCGAFQSNMPAVGWKLIKDKKYDIGIDFIISYITYCINMVKENKFTPNLITKFVKFHNEESLLIADPNFLKHITPLINLLNSKENNLTWTVNPCTINGNGICSCCNSSLNAISISQEEFDTLRSSLLKECIIDTNINLKTTESELAAFRKFLQTCPPYDIVIDGLNIYHLTKKSDMFNEIINYFIRKNMKILIIARHHFRNLKVYNIVKNKCSIFLTQNISEDDVFFIYSTLHGGLKTCFLSSDLLRGYSRYLKDSKMQKIFKRWQKSHQYVLHRGGILQEPMPYEILPQSLQKNKEFFWHFPLNIVGSPGIRSLEEIDWVCLCAQSSKKLKSRE